MYTTYGDIFPGYTQTNNNNNNNGSQSNSQVVDENVPQEIGIGQSTSTGPPPSSSISSHSITTDQMTRSGPIVSANPRNYPLSSGLPIGTNTDSTGLIHSIGSSAVDRYDPYNYRYPNQLETERHDLKRTKFQTQHASSTSSSPSQSQLQQQHQQSSPQLQPSASVPYYDNEYPVYTPMHYSIAPSHQPQNIVQHPSHISHQRPRHHRHVSATPTQDKRKTFEGTSTSLRRSATFDPSKGRPRPLGHRRTRSTQDRESSEERTLMSLYLQGKTPMEIGAALGMDESQVKEKYKEIVSRNVEWDAGDIECLKSLLIHGERAKWKYISGAICQIRGKRLTASACQRKFQDMFGIAESSSMLGSSLPYVLAKDGWSCLPATLKSAQ